MQTKQKNISTGAVFLFFIFGLLFFVLAGRFLFIQVTGEAGGTALSRKLETKYLRQDILEARRGSIVDRNGEAIAEDTVSYKLTAILDRSVTSSLKNPKHVVDPKKTAEKLSKYIEMDEDEIFKLLNKKGVFQVEFGTAGKDITHQTKNEIESLKLPGIMFQRESKRFYPNGVFSSHLIGFTENKFNAKTKQTDSMGSMGLEKTMEKYLKETDGIVKYDSDRWGFLLPNSKERITAPKDGSTVSVTLDKKIQTFLEDSLNTVQMKYNPKKMIAIVANPKTGEILAMSQRPTFHPKSREGLENGWQNLALEDSFEPGSTMKVFTLAASVQENVFNPNELYKSGTYKVNKSGVIRDHNGGQGWGTISYLEGLQRSSNVAFAKLAMEKLGEDKFRNYLTKFGFDKPTGIDLPYEATGKILYKWPIEKVTTAFGQGTAITPIQQVQAASAIANDGKMMKPFVIKEVADPVTKKVIKETKPTVVSQPISAETAKKVRDYLGTVVTAENGTGKRYKINGYDVAGKTGTAQMPGPDGKYLQGNQNYVFSFLGMAPKNDPKLVMYVAVQQPEVEYYADGGIPVSMIFNTVMRNSLQYLNIEPSKTETKKAEAIEDFTEKDIKSSAEELKSRGYQVTTLGTGTQIIDQNPKPGTKLLEGERIILRSEGQLTAPNMKGWSLRDAMKLAKIGSIPLQTVGNGYVVKQNIKAGNKLSDKDYLIVQMKTPEDTQKKEPETDEENRGS
ncbi:penicillin-binding protein 2B [Peribacillus deserti]|uniref:serine-type D-Ala-D-Ala carboxypeptidase n=1 Tax=Peribacillus deserti TaxID=673318 RepID=A0ABS2QGV4_9BACI|nr:penicillin-binding transpeptidase domain-containing protein [Peribacillus deserti]MBM7692368.1 penicillin-binding protein 2B [Peribacillus deserti]